MLRKKSSVGEGAAIVLHEASNDAGVEGAALRVPKRARARVCNDEAKLHKGSCDEEQAGKRPTHADCVWPFGFRFCTLFGLSFGVD